MNKYQLTDVHLTELFVESLSIYKKFLFHNSLGHNVLY